MGKGSADRTDDREAFDKNHPKAFGERKPWWIMRDEKLMFERYEKEVAEVIIKCGLVDMMIRNKGKEEISIKLPNPQTRKHFIFGNKLTMDCEKEWKEGKLDIFADGSIGVCLDLDPTGSHK